MRSFTTLGCHVASPRDPGWRKVGNPGTSLQLLCTQYLVQQVRVLLKAGMLVLSSCTIALCSRFRRALIRKLVFVHRRMGQLRQGSVGMPKQRKRAPWPVDTLT